MSFNTNHYVIFCLSVLKFLKELVHSFEQMKLLFNRILFKKTILILKYLLEIDRNQFVYI